jgi:hypothetical protein
MSKTLRAIQKRNLQWENNPTIPSWVDIDDVGLDQFFTKPEVADWCYGRYLNTLAEDGAKLDDFTFVEPSAGDGAFYDLLPKNKRVGIDIDPKRAAFTEADFLSWMPAETRKPIATVGNPPFGYRAWLALAFINHAAKFSDYIGFILPMAFQSDGKGSPKFRVKGMQLVSTEFLPEGSFVDPNGKSLKINALWQVWKKGENIQPEPLKCDDWIDLFTVDQRKERLCGHERMHEADYFIQRTYYNTPPTLVKNFSDVKYVCGYGIVFKKHSKEIERVLRETNWNDYSNLAAHNCRHISMYHIIRALTDKGFVND